MTSWPPVSLGGLSKEDLVTLVLDLQDEMGAARRALNALRRSLRLYVHFADVGLIFLQQRLDEDGQGGDAREMVALERALRSRGSASPKRGRGRPVASRP